MLNRIPLELFSTDLSVPSSCRKIFNQVTVCLTPGQSIIVIVFFESWPLFQPRHVDRWDTLFFLPPPSPESRSILKRNRIGLTNSLLIWSASLSVWFQSTVCSFPRSFISHPYHVAPFEWTRTESFIELISKLCQKVWNFYFCPLPY